MFVNRNLSFIGLIVASILIVIVFLLFISYFNIGTYVGALFDWLSQQGYRLIFIYIIIECLIVVLLLPGFVITVGAGFLFGFFKGFLIMLFSTTLGASIAFVISRYFFGEYFKRNLQKYEKLSLFNHELVTEGWKIILLSRLIPFFPSKLANYFLGANDFKYTHFLVGTFFGFIPITAFNVYLGFVAGDISRVINMETQSNLPLIIWFYGTGLLLSAFFIAYIFHLAKKSIDKYSNLHIKK